MNILGKNYEFVKVGRLEVATTSIYYPELAMRAAKGECYSIFKQVKEIDELLKEIGCRVTTRQDLIYLARLGSCWVEKGERGNAIAGRFFGENAKEATMENLNGCVFFPAAGYYAIGDDALHCIGKLGSYWSSTVCSDDIGAYSLGYSGGTLTVEYGYEYIGFPVRCVRDIK